MPQTYYIKDSLPSFRDANKMKYNGQPFFAFFSSSKTNLICLVYNDYFIVNFWKAARKQTILNG